MGNAKALRILVVEDDPDLAEVTAALLRKLGHSAVVAWSADSAMSIWKETNAAFDLLLIDYMLGAASGAKLAVKLGKERPEMPVILMSGYGEAHIEMPSSKVKYLGKPFSPTELKKAIEGCVDQKTGEA